MEMNIIPRSEHPNPQWKRKSFYNLNGEWDFEIDRAFSGFDRELASASSLSSKINVPFCPESELSGVGDKDFMDAVWYKRTVFFSDEQLSGNRIILHFGAADFKAHVFINGRSAGLPHIGGFTPFEYDITDLVFAGDNLITICCEDRVRDDSQPSGKQSPRSESYRAYYTRVTGIWQTVWYEIVPRSYIKKMKLNADPESATVSLALELSGEGALCAKAYYEGRLVGEVNRNRASGFATVELPLSEKHLWEVGAGRLYDLRLTFGEDEVESYFGLRSISLDGGRLCINGKPIFMRLVLDQGYYPDGIYTAPTESALIKDIELAIAAGFNGARPHQKVFEPLYLYHADRLGFILWGEYPSWGVNLAKIENLATFLPDWLSSVERDINHPSIVGWCPLNETSHTQNRFAATQDNEFLRIVYEQTKAKDPGRPCIDTSGWTHVITDIFDVHDYEQSPERMHEKYDPLFKDGKLYDRFSEVWRILQDWRGINDPIQVWHGEPVFMSEYGGIGLHILSENEDGSAWSYGNAARSLEEFYERYKGLTDALLDNPKMLGFCYTQLYDIEQEQNGLYYYDRTPKMDMARIRSINSRMAAIEK